MTQASWPNLVTMFFAQARKKGEAPLFYSKSTADWQSVSWQDAAKDVAKMAGALRQMGVEKGDRVVLLSDNSPNWAIADMAIMAAGAISVPTYTTYATRDYLHILENSDAKAAIVSTRKLAKVFLKAAHESDAMQHVIMMEDPKLEQHLNAEISHWDELLAASTTTVEEMEALNAKVTRDDLACLIYTSGTGGQPKGVKIHHGSILHNCEGAVEVIRPLGLEDNCFLSFLPLSHAYEHSAGLYFPISIGAKIYYAQSLDRLVSNMAEARPTVMVVVPRLFEMIRMRLLRQIEKDGGLKKKLIGKALSLGLKRVEGTPFTLLEKLQDLFIDLTVRRKIHKTFGGRIKALVSGGAPLATDVGNFFAALGIPLLQGYGQTESGPVVSVNPPHDPRMATVGKLLKNTEVKIADDGEILVRGELVMKGYWRNDTATAEAIQDGWLHTGDIGIYDNEGFLHITDRKKDILINDKGDNISPQRIEGMLALEDEIAQAMVYGDRRPYLVGLLVPDQEWLNDWASANGKSNKLAELTEDKALIKALQDAVDRVNSRLSGLERIRKFTIASESFNIENEQMTPTLKIRRHKINAVYGEGLNRFYR